MISNLSYTTRDEFKFFEQKVEHYASAISFTHSKKQIYMNMLKYLFSHKSMEKRNLH